MSHNINRSTILATACIMIFGLWIPLSAQQPRFSGFLQLDKRFNVAADSLTAADKLNPTDNLNPDDFSDLVNFAEKIPSWAVKATYYLGGLYPNQGVAAWTEANPSSTQWRISVPGQWTCHLRQTVMTEIGSVSGTRQFDAQIELGFPEIQVVGADFAAELWAVRLSRCLRFFDQLVARQHMLQKSPDEQLEQNSAKKPIAHRDEFSEKPIFSM